MSHFNKENDDYSPAGGISQTGATSLTNTSNPAVSPLYFNNLPKMKMFDIYSPLSHKKTTVDYKMGYAGCFFFYTKSKSVRTGPVKDYIVNSIYTYIYMY